MSALAKYCLFCANKVSGSDVKNSKSVKELTALGAKIFVGHSEKNVVNDQLVVYNSAIEKDNPELKKAEEMGLPLLTRSQFLGRIINGYKSSIGVSGSHGKTTSTAMIAHILVRANKAPLAFIGGEDVEFGNFLCGNGDILLTEACEFSKSFLDLDVSVAVVLNIDNDHLDCYGSIENLTLAFKQFLSDKIAVINADDSRLKRISGDCAVTFAIKNNAAYKAEKLAKNKHGGYSFTVYRYGIKLGRINLKVIGKHNVYNALAAVAVAGVFNIDFNVVKKSLENFKGVERRMENLGEIYKMQAVADYAHHPSEISSSLSAFYKEGDIYVFQPHTYSRTRILIDDFVLALKDYQGVIYATYPAREEFDAKGSAYRLYRKLKKEGANCDYASSKSELFKKLKKLSKGKKRIIFLGAGDIYDIAKQKAGEKR